MSETKSITVLNKEISKELSDPAVGRALLATTFKGLSDESMRKAIFEGMIRGFKFKDFLEKNVYAIPFSNGYSLVTSIDYARKLGAKNGVVGVTKPTYVMDDKNKEIVSCEITVKKKVDGYVGDFTAEVFFDEYYKAGKNGYPSLWDSKPRTMIAKVAESHALRKACPEVLAQMYTEEEMQKDADDSFDKTDITDDTEVISTGDDGNDLVVPESESERKILIFKELKRLMPDIDVADAKEVKRVAEDITQLAYKAENFGNIIHLLHRK